MQKSIGTYKGRSVYVEILPSGDRVPFYNAKRHLVYEDGLKKVYPKGKLIRVYINPSEVVRMDVVMCPNPNCIEPHPLKLKRSRNSEHHRYECEECGTRVQIPKEVK